MTLPSWIAWLKGTPGRKGRAEHHGPRWGTVTPRRSFVPRLEALEDRTVPSGLQHGLSAGGLYNPRALVFHTAGDANRAPDLGDCQNLQVPAGDKGAFHRDGPGGPSFRRKGMGSTSGAPGAGWFCRPGGGGAG